jgi:hypothetical protein
VIRPRPLRCCSRSVRAPDHWGVHFSPGCRAGGARARVFRRLVERRAIREVWGVTPVAVGRGRVILRSQPSRPPRSGVGYRRSAGRTSLLRSTRGAKHASQEAPLLAPRTIRVCDAIGRRTRAQRSHANTAQAARGATPLLSALTIRVSPWETGCILLHRMLL